MLHCPRRCGPEYAVLTGATIAAYTAYTLGVTQVSP